MRKIPCTYYVYSDTAIGDIDKIQAINQSLIDHEFAKNILKEGQMLNGTYHIKDMDHIHIPALITDTTSKYYTVGSKVESSSFCGSTSKYNSGITKPFK